jgi:hypothetical protein
MLWPAAAANRLRKPAGRLRAPVDPARVSMTLAAAEESLLLLAAEPQARLAELGYQPALPQHVIVNVLSAWTSRSSSAWEAQSTRTRSQPCADLC